MVKHLTIVLLLLLGFNKSWAIVGDSCSNPAVANLCGDGSFTASTQNFNIYYNTWTFNGKQINTYGTDIFYRINLPVSAYQPVSIAASLAGYFNCTNCSTTDSVNFLWFQQSPCSSNPVAVSKFSITGSSSFYDSLFSSFSIISAQSTYYLVICFDRGNYYPYPGNYSYNLQLGFTNNQPPPQLNCTTGKPPYKGDLTLDKSAFYSSSNPYEIPLANLNDNPLDNVTFVGCSAKGDSLVVNDNNGQGYILTIRTSEDYYTHSEVYSSYDQNAYQHPNYGGGLGYVFDVAVTVIFNNDTGAAGIKGFRIQAPNAVPFSGNQYGTTPNGPGIYDPSGNWTVHYDANTNTYTWLFTGNGGRGDNVSNNGYSHQAYTFDCEFFNIGDTLNFWYLPDNYGSDKQVCTYGVSNPPRTDCSLTPPESDWIQLGGNGGGGSLSGQKCGSLQVFSGPDIVSFGPCNPNQQDIDTATVDANGCYNETDVNYIYEKATFVPPLQGGGQMVGGICSGMPYLFSLSAFSFGYGITTPSIIAYYDSTTHVYHPVDSLGNINFNVNCDTLSLPSGIPPYPNPGANRNYTFTVPLHTPGTYTVLYTLASFSYNYNLHKYILDGGYILNKYCSAGNLVIVNRNKKVNITFNPADTSVCAGQPVWIREHGARYFTWLPENNVDSNPDSLVSISPQTSSTYTVIGVDIYTCADTTTYVIHADTCPPIANFNQSLNNCSSYCANFSNTSVNEPNFIKWSFPGGTPSSYIGTTPPQVCYPAKGVYTAKLFVSNSAGADSITKYVQVGTCKPFAIFSANDSFICRAGCVSFYNQTPLGNNSYSNWYFPGGNPLYFYTSYSGEQPPLICYADTGNYNARLIALNSLGSDTSYITIHVINCTNKAVAGFALKDSICRGDCVTLTNTSSANSTNWQWTFAGGTPSAYSGKNPPNVCYNTAGKFNVQLITSNSSSADTLIKTVLVNACMPIAGFESKDSICPGDCVTFTDTSSANSINWQWVFNGGTPATYSGQNPPAVCYAALGTYPIQLIASNNSGSDTALQNITVYKYNAGNITVHADTLCSGNPAVLSLQNSWGALQWQQSDTTNNFTSISGATSDSYKFSAVNQNTYVRVIAGSNNCADTSQILKLTTLPPLSGSFTWTVAGQTASFVYHDSSGTPISYSWNFSDGDTASILANPVHVYAAKDTTYYVCVTVYDGTNCSFTYCKNVTVGILTGVAGIATTPGINLYPNPAMDELTVEVLNNFTPKQIAIVDALGRTILQTTPAKATAVLNVHNYAAGIYFVKIQLGDGSIQVRKFVKQ